jgi:hypothetical protein
MVVSVHLYFTCMYLKSAFSLSTSRAVGRVGDVNSEVWEHLFNAWPEMRSLDIHCKTVSMLTMQLATQRGTTNHVTMRTWGTTVVSSCVKDRVIGKSSHIQPVERWQANDDWIYYAHSPHKKNLCNHSTYHCWTKKDKS